MDRFEMVPVALAASGFEAKVLAARLGSEGVVWELRGDVDSVYPVGGIEVLVPLDEVDHARDLLAPDPVDDHDGLDDRDGLDDAPADGSLAVGVRQLHRRLLVAGAAVFVLLFVTVRLMAMG